MLGADIHHPLATTQTHVAWQSETLRLECNRVRNLATAEDDIAVRVGPAMEPSYEAVIIPLSPTGRLHLLARYRYAVARWSLEFPRFGFDSSEAGWKDAAEADLYRVTGLSPKSVHLLGALHVDPALLTTSTMVIVAKGCARARASASPAETSTAETTLIAGSVVVSPAELFELVHRGEVVCGVTLAALTLHRAWQT